MTSFSEQTQKRRVKQAIHWSFRAFIWLLCVLRGISVEIDKKEILQNASNCVLVANHPSLLDVVLLISCIPRADCIIKSKLLKNPFFGRVVRRAYIPNDEDPMVLLDRCKQSLDQGNVVVIFPEGTRTTPGSPVKLSRGAANVALRAEVNILPVTLTCVPSGISKDHHWYSVPQDTMRYSVAVGEMILAKSHSGSRDLTKVIKTCIISE